MAEKEEKKKQEKKAEPKKAEERIRAEQLIRILATDIPGNNKLYHGLTKIKGVSWAFSNAVCNSLHLNKDKKISELTEKDIELISNFIKSPKLPEFILNRRKDEETGVSKHLVTTELDLTKDFDIRRMKKIKSYKGWRHAFGQPVRGQRTRSHFRHGGAMGVMKSKSTPGSAAAAAKATPAAKGGKK